MLPHDRNRVESIFKRIIFVECRRIHIKDRIIFLSYNISDKLVILKIHVISIYIYIYEIVKYI